MTTAATRRTLALTTLAGALALAGCTSAGTVTVDGGSASAGGTATASGSGPASGSTPSGDSAGSGADTAALKAAAAATTAAGSAKLSLDETVQGGGKTYTVKGSGSTDLSGTGNGEFTLVTAGQSIQTRVIGKVLYELLPPAARSAVPGKKPWVRIDTAKAAAGSNGTVSAPDVAQSLGYLQNAQNVTKVGTETVDGTSTTHYRFQAALPRTSASQLGVSLPTSVPVDVWVDGQQRIREERIQLTITASATASASASASTQSVTSTTDLKMSGFGTPVKVTAPPAAQTADLTGAAASALATTSTG
jgi:hypothetical protein